MLCQLCKAERLPHRQVKEDLLLEAAVLPVEVQIAISWHVPSCSMKVMVSAAHCCETQRPGNGEAFDHSRPHICTAVDVESVLLVLEEQTHRS